MIYSSIPPILIVVSLAGIVIFLIKKAPQVASLEDFSAEVDLNKKRSLLARIIRKKEPTEEGKDFKHRILLFLEKITKKLKLLFLKLENIFSSWGDSFRNKRQAREEERIAQLEEIIEKKEIFKREKLNVSEEEEIAIHFTEPVRPVEPVQPMKPVEEPVNKPVQPIKPVISVKPIEPIIESIKEEKKEKVKPRGKKKNKEVLENILVERIATNPRDTEAYEQLGEYYLEVGQWDYAKECFKQVLKIDPKSSSVKKKMKKLEKMFGE